MSAALAWLSGAIRARLGLFVEGFTLHTSRKMVAYADLTARS